MPEIVVYAVEGRTVEQKRGLMKDLTQAMVKNFGVPADAVGITMVESAKDNKAKGRGAVLGNVGAAGRKGVLTFASEPLPGARAVRPFRHYPAENVCGISEVPRICHACGTKLP